MSNLQPVFHFTVEWGGTRVGFTEVSGLSDEVSVIEYRDGSSAVDSSTLVPGLKSPPVVTLKRGIMTGDNEIADWFRTIRTGTVERRDLTISLLNAEHEPTVTWKLADAWPRKISASDLNARANEIAIESLEIVCERIIRDTD
jgi:phage tail-like protein